jgi:uncharacterized protein YegL
MPRLDGNLQSHALPTGSYGFSAQRIDDLGASEYTLCTIIVDDSSSVAPFLKEMVDCVKSALNACKYSPRADYLMVRVVTFGNNLSEYHGFKMLSEVKLADYDKLLGVGGMTALYDAFENGVSATATYGKQLIASDYSVNGIVIGITDGGDNMSVGTINSVANALKSAMSNECLESIKTILVGVNVADAGLSQLLQKFKTEAGLDQYIEIGKADVNSLAKLADWVSKSISAQSQSLGTGGPSQSLAF